MKIALYPKPKNEFFVPTLENISEFYKKLLDLRAKGSVEEIETLICLDDNGPGFRDLWTNPIGKDRMMFTLTKFGCFRCWGRPCSYTPNDDHFDAGGDDALLFEVRSTDFNYLEMKAFAIAMVGNLSTWHCDADYGQGNTLWFGRSWGCF